MAYTISLFAAAEDDLDGAVAWYGERHVTLAERFYAAYHQTLDAIREMPMRFPVCGKDIRKARFPEPFPYSVLYLLRGNAVFIVSVLHHKRSEQVWKKRLQ